MTKPRVLSLLGAFIAFMTLLAPLPAAAWIHGSAASGGGGGGGGGDPTVLTPGAYVPGTGSWPTCETTVTCSPVQGASFASEFPPPVIWDVDPYTVISGTTTICAHAGALGTSSTVQVSGNDTALSYARYSWNNGAWVKVTTQTTSPINGQKAFCIAVNTALQGYSGLAAFRVEICPVDGVCAEEEQPDAASAPCTVDCELDLNVDNGGLYWTGSTVHVDLAHGVGTPCGSGIGTLACNSPCAAEAQLAATSPNAGDISNTKILLAPGSLSIDCATAYTANKGRVMVTYDAAAGGSKSNVILTGSGTNGLHVNKFDLHSLTYHPTSRVTGWTNGGANSDGLQTDVALSGTDMYASGADGPFHAANYRRAILTTVSVDHWAYGCQGLYKAQNLTATYISADVDNNCQNSLNIVTNHQGGTYRDLSSWATINGTTTSGSLAMTVDTTAYMGAGDNVRIWCNTTSSYIYGSISGPGGQLTIVDGTHITLSGAAPSASCSSISMDNGAHTDLMQFQDAYADVVVMGYTTDGSVSAQGTSYAQGVPYVSNTTTSGAANSLQRAFFYNVNSSIANNGNANWQLRGSGANKYVVFSHLTLAGGAFNSVTTPTGTFTDIQLNDATCKPRNPAGIGNTGLPWSFTYFNVPASNAC